MPSSFEQIVEELGLSPEEYQSSRVLKNWARRNMDNKYVPWELLNGWGFVEDERDTKAA
jgi:hypothetical protein